MHSLLLRTYAKINLGLQVLEKRSDNFHKIETIFHRINLFDEIKFQFADSGVFFSSSSSEIDNENNLCVKAVKLFQGKLKFNFGIKINLEKKIPIGAGLGGGSSDAASILIGLCKFFDIELSNSTLNEIAIQLGSDVSYFLKNGSAYATNRGENLEYFELKIPYWIVVVYPNIHISTLWAYQNIIPNNLKRKNLKLLVQNFSYGKEKIKNDFEKTIFEKFPEIQKIKNSFYEFGAMFSLMSGSGSSVFGFFEDELSAKKFFEYNKNQYKTFLTEPNFYPYD